MSTKTNESAETSSIGNTNDQSGLSPSVQGGPVSKKVMIVSPYFMPMRAVGAKRALHFVRHLPQRGWACAAISLPIEIKRDPNLEDLIPDIPIWRGLKGGPLARREAKRAMRRAHNSAQQSHAPKQSLYAAQNREAELGRLHVKFSDRISSAGKRFWRRSFHIFDQYTKYLPWVYRDAARFFDTQNCQVVYASAGPFSALKLATLLAHRANVPLVLDLRDPWTLEPNYRANRNIFGQWVTNRVELFCFKRASRIILNTQASYQAYVDAYRGRIEPERFTFIRNCFDPDLYVSLPPPPPTDGPFTIAYFGHLRPSKNALLFLDAYRVWIDEYQLTPQDTSLLMLGEISRADQEKMKTLQLADYLKSTPPVPFPQAPNVLGRVDLLLDLMGPNHHLQISGKIYDYFACRRPILSVSPNQELDEIFESTRAGHRVPLEASAIIKVLQKRYQEKRTGINFQPDLKAMQRFSAQVATKQLAQILNEVSTT